MTFTLIANIRSVKVGECDEEYVAEASQGKSAGISDPSRCQHCVNQLSQARRLIVLLCISAAIQ